MSTERRIEELERRMGDTEKLVSDTAKTVAVQAMQMGIVWRLMTVGVGAVLLSVLGLILTAAFGKPVVLHGG